MRLTVRSIQEEIAARAPDAAALLAPGREPATFRQLCAHTDRIVRALNGAGIGRGDRVAVVAPNGPEMAAAFLAVSCAAVCAPLNPAYRAQEFEFYLKDLRAKAIIVPFGEESAARQVAADLGIRVLELIALPDQPAGLFDLETGDGLSAESIYAEPDDVALVLHTSGTTSRPKIVPLTHRNVVSSATHIKETLQLEPADRCLNIMPLFHIHGLIGATLSSIAAGCSIVCTPGFQAPKILGWIEEFQPSWYTAVPTMHQAILARAENQSGNGFPLRLIRSSSAALPPQVMARLEEVFGAPVIESYGMTEAAHQMASNPLPPGARKPGSVGLAAGPDVAVMDASGNMLTNGETGEVVIRGPNVTAGYENNAQANEGAYTNGWFRTGDQGYLDEEDYLFLTGRLKEIINRGGEKISPREIDEILLDHPAVDQAVAFALPDELLGEDVAAAIVLRPDQNVTERQLREFAASRLADFKVPTRIVFLDEIPKGPTGKLQRIGLAAKLGLDSPAPQSMPVASFEPPKGETEKLICGIWTEVLGLKQVGRNDDFFRCGGDSVLATMLLARLQQSLGRCVTIIQLFENATPRALASLLAEPSAASADVAGAIPVRPPGEEIELSSGQQRLWFLQQFQAEPALLNRPVAFRLSGGLDRQALEHSLTLVCERHESLRVNYSSRHGLPAAKVRDASPVPVNVRDLSELPEAERETELQRLCREEARRPFDIKNDLVLRACLFRLGPADHLFFLCFHHIAFDGWSAVILARELAVAYGSFAAGAEPDLPPLPIQYSDFAHWQNHRLRDEVLDGPLSYWREQLGGVLPVLELPTDRPRPPRRTLSGGRVSVVLPPGLADSLTSLGRQENTTLFATLLAAFNALLHRESGQEDIIVGSPVAGRLRVETEPLIGVFINTLALRTDLSGSPTFRELLGRVRSVVNGALSHQELSFDRLVVELRPPRVLDRAPIFSVFFQLRNLPRAESAATGLTFVETPVESGFAEFDISLDMQDCPDGLHCHANYSTALFDAESIGRLLDEYQRILEAALSNPDQPIAVMS